MAQRRPSGVANFIGQVHIGDHVNNNDVDDETETDVDIGRNTNDRSGRQNRFSRENFHRQHFSFDSFIASGPFNLLRGYRGKKERNSSKNVISGYCDVVSTSIRHGMWHIVEKIFSYLDAHTLRHCEEVSDLWRDYIRSQNVWRKVVEKEGKLSQHLIEQNGWSKYLSNSIATAEEHEVEIYQRLYWKMTNLCETWKNPNKSPSEVKNHFQRSGTIVWKFLPSQRAVSIYNCGKGFVVKIHDQQTFRFRGAHKETSGTVKKDSLCLDATDDRIVVGGMASQKVWIFKIVEYQIKRSANLLDMIVTGISNKGAPSYLIIDDYKFINAETGVKKVQIHPTDISRIAVLLPTSQLVEIWNVDERTRLQSFVVTSDSCYLLWKRTNLLITAPLFSGILMVFDPDNGTEISPMVGNIRRIDCIDTHENLCVTGENQIIRIWSLSEGRSLVSWNGAKTFISALLINDIMVVSGSSAGSVKLWDLKTLLSKNIRTISPLRKISMKGVLHYPIKDIFQFTYTDLIIVAKYEANRRKDKIKIVRVSKPNF